MTIEFERPEFHASVAEIRRTARLLTHDRARASTEVERLLDSWHGAAAGAFAEAWEDWRRAAGQVASELGGIADALEVYHDDLTAHDAEAAAGLDVLAARLS